MMVPSCNVVPSVDLSVNVTHVADLAGCCELQHIAIHDFLSTVLRVTEVDFVVAF